MIRILQINLNGCQAAQDVMIQTAEERRADLVIVSEQYRNIPHRWYSDASSRSAIYTPTAHLRITNAVSIGVQGWTWVEMRGVRFYSCYFSPSATVEEFKRDLVCLEDDVRTSTLPVVVAGDFNSKAPEWGSQKTDRRGILLSEMASHLHLHAANVGSAYTFVRGSTGSVIDVTFAGETIIGRIRKWQVLDSYSHSDHRYIGFELEDRLAGPQMLPSSSGWGARKLDIVALDEAVAELRSKKIIYKNDHHDGKTSISSVSVFPLCTRQRRALSPTGSKKQRHLAIPFWKTTSIGGASLHCNPGEPDLNGGYYHDASTTHPGFNLGGNRNTNKKGFTWLCEAEDVSYYYMTSFLY
ncbi:uncharacterized protein LOC143912391 [Arctopsyche grandis]|uniref:uncharacterized protein LOC143912391 n=2 Tax=Arctopsyche grandis TaxID=121162 RepID=UPI00406DA161